MNNNLTAFWVCIGKTKIKKGLPFVLKLLYHGSVHRGSVVWSKLHDFEGILLPIWSQNASLQQLAGWTEI